jgi:hypothetical protein
MSTKNCFRTVFTFSQSFGVRCPIFLTKVDFSTVANLSSRIMDGSRSPARCQSTTDTSRGERAIWLVTGSDEQVRVTTVPNDNHGTLLVAPAIAEHDRHKQNVSRGKAHAGLFVIVDGVLRRILSGKLRR